MFVCKTPCKLVAKQPRPSIALVLATKDWDDYLKLPSTTHEGAFGEDHANLNTHRIVSGYQGEGGLTVVWKFPRDLNRIPGFKGVYDTPIPVGSYRMIPDTWHPSDVLNYGEATKYRRDTASSESVHVLELEPPPSIRVVSYNISFGVAKQKKTIKHASEYEFVRKYCFDDNRCRTNEFASLKNLVRKVGKLSLVGLQEYIAWDDTAEVMNDRGTTYTKDHPAHLPIISNTIAYPKHVQCFGVAHENKDVPLSDTCTVDDLCMNTRESHTGVCQLRYFYEATFTAWDTRVFGKSINSAVLQLSDATNDARPCHIFVTERNYILINAHFPQLSNNRQGAVVNKINEWLAKNAHTTEADFHLIFVGDTNDDDHSSAQLSTLQGVGASPAKNKQKTCCFADDYKYTSDYILWSEGLVPIDRPSTVRYDGTLYRDSKPTQVTPRSDHEPVYVELNRKPPPQWACIGTVPHFIQGFWRVTDGEKTRLNRLCTALANLGITMFPCHGQHHALVFKDITPQHLGAILKGPRGETVFNALLKASNGSPASRVCLSKWRTQYQQVFEVAV